MRGIGEITQKKPPIIALITDKDPKGIYRERVERLARQAVKTTHETRLEKPWSRSTGLSTDGIGLERRILFMG